MQRLLADISFLNGSYQEEIFFTITKFGNGRFYFRGSPCNTCSALSGTALCGSIVTFFVSFLLAGSLMGGGHDAGEVDVGIALVLLEICDC